jgi:hypothetical protein
MARLVENDLEAAIRELKGERDGEIEVAGKPYFAGPRPPLRLVTNDRIAGDVIRLTYVPA